MADDRPRNVVIHIEELFEHAKQCFALALVSSDVDVKQILQQIGDQLLNEAHELSDRSEGWVPKLLTAANNEQSA
jgi:hypothetical protein